MRNTLVKIGQGLLFVLTLTAIVAAAVAFILLSGDDRFPSWDEEQRINKEWNEFCEAFPHEPDC